MDRSRTLIVLLVSVLLATAWAYREAWTVGLIYEDELWSARLWAPLEWGVPSRALTLWMHQWTAASVPAAHAVNVAIHLLNGALVFLLVRGLLAPDVALAASAVFLWHPLNTEAVVYLHGRADLLVTTGLLMTAIGVRSQAWAVAAIGVAVALTTKETGLVALPLVAMCWPRAGVAWLKDSPSAVWVLLMTVAAGLALLIPLVTTWVSLAAMSRWDFAPLQAAAILQLLTNAVWPASLSIDHDPLVVAPWLRALALGGLIAWAVLAWRLRSHRAWVLVAWPLLMVAPRFAVYHAETINEHQFYPAMVGVSVSLVAGVVWSMDAVRGLRAFAWYRPLPGWTDMGVGLASLRGRPDC